jgi:hypothetical protein
VGHFVMGCFQSGMFQELNLLYVHRNMYTSQEGGGQIYVCVQTWFKTQVQACLITSHYSPIMLFENVFK